MGLASASSSAANINGFMAPTTGAFVYFLFCRDPQVFGPEWMPWGKKAEEDSVPPATQAATQSAVSICCVICTIQLSVVGNAEGARGISAMCVLVGQHVMLTHACVGQVCARVRAHPHPHARLFSRC